jgi:A/G-specific adenine glycosylase
MLQQTQVSRVIPKYERWLKEFPTVQALAEARTSEVLRYWSGLGYNRRALNLHKAARLIVAEYRDTFPQEPGELEKLPGIGKYTSHAIACFAFDRQVSVIDTNIRKVIAVMFFHGELPSENIMEEVAQQLLPKEQAYEWNQALMDYAGAMLKEHKIPIPKQSHFFTSNRYYRGQTIKQLLDRHMIELDVLLAFFAKQGRAIEKTRLEKIVFSLQKEGFLQYEGDTLRLNTL